MLLEIRAVGGRMILVNPERCTIIGNGDGRTEIHDHGTNKCLYTKETYKQIKQRISIHVSGCMSKPTKQPCQTNCKRT